MQRSADRLRITVQLIDAADGAHLWSERFDRPARDLFTIQDEIAAAVVGALRVTLLGDQQATLSRRQRVDQETYDLYLKGLYVAARRTPEAYAQAVECFERVLGCEPAYAPALAALAWCCCGSGFVGYIAPEAAFPKAKAAALKALELDSALSEAHAALGAVAWIDDWHWAKAEDHFQRAVEATGNSVLAHFWHAFLLTVTSRFDEALREIQRAWELDPLSLVVQTNVGCILFERREYDAAIRRHLQTLELDPDFGLANFHLGRAWYVLGRYEDAVAALQKAAPGFAVAMGALGAAWAELGRRDKTLEILRDLKTLSARRHVSPIAFATVYRALNDPEAALACYEAAFDAREGIVPLLAVDPLLWIRCALNPDFRRWSIG